jgi:hypothetical protein
MIVLPSGLGMGVGRFSRPLRGVGVLAMLDAGLDTTQSVESVCQVPTGASILQLLVPCLAIGVFIDLCRVADGLEATHCVISAMQELFSEDTWVQF